MTLLDPIQNGKFASSTTTSLQQNRRKQAICCICPSSLLALLLTIVAVSPSFSPSVTPPVVQAAIPQFFSSQRRTLHNAEQQQQQQQSTNSSHSTVLPQQQRNAYPRRQPRQQQHHPFGFHATLREEQQIAQQPSEQPATPRKRAEGGAVVPQSQPQMVNRWRIASSAVVTTNDPQQQKLKPAALHHRQRPPPPPQSVSMDLWTMVKSLWTRRKEKQKRQQRQRIASVQKEDAQLVSAPKPLKTPPPLPSKGEVGRGEAQAQLKPPAESSTDIDPSSSVAVASSKQTEDEGGATRKAEESQAQQQKTGVFSTYFGRSPPPSQPKLSVDQDTRGNELDAISATGGTTTVSASSAEFANHVNVDTDAEETNGVEDDSTKDNDTNKHAPPQQRFAFWRNNGKPPTSKGTKDDDATTTTDADTLTKDSLQTATTPQTATDLEALKDEDHVVNVRDDSVPLENAEDFPSEFVANETTDVSSMMDSVAEAVFQEDTDGVQTPLAEEDETRDERNEWAQTSDARLTETEIDEGQFEFRQRMEALADRLAEAQQPQTSEETMGEEGVDRKDPSGEDVEIEDGDEEEEALPSDYNDEEAEELDNVESLLPTPQIDEDNEIIDLDVLDELEAQHRREIDAQHETDAARQEIEADLIDSTEAVLEDEYDETITDDEYEYDDEDDDVLLEADDQELTLDDWFGPPIFSARPGRRKRWTVHKNGLAASHPSIASAIFWVAQRYDEQFLARISEQLVELQHQQEEERNELLAQALAAREQHQLAKAERKQALRLRRRPIPMLAKMNVSEIEDGPDLTDEEFELLLQQLENEPIFEPISDYTDDEDTDEFDEALEMELESLQNPLQAFQLPQVAMKDSFMFQKSQVVSGLQLLDLTDHFDDSDEQLLLESEEQHQPGGRPRGDERLNEGDVWILVESNEYSELLDNTAEG